MSNNSSPCMTCALRVTSLHSDAASDARADAVFREFKRHHKPEAFRVHDLTGPKEKNATWYCVIGDNHFNRDNVKCPNWIPDINGITPAEALKLHQNKPSQKRWYEKLLWQFLGVIASGLLIAYLSHLFGWTDPKEPSRAITQKTSSHISTDQSVQNVPKKIPLKTPPSKESGTIASQPTVSVSNSNIFIGSNAGTVSQTVNHYPEPKPVPLKERLILCLNEIDNHVLSALRSGTTKFEIELESYQLPELKRLYAEDSTHKYISSLKVTEAYLRLSGSYTKIQLELLPALLQ